MKQQETGATAGAASDGAKKERHRSPNYPAVGLRDAVERVRNLFLKGGKAGAPAAIAAKYIGFGSAHGQSYSVLAALKKFDLTGEINGRIVPTQRAIEIINLPDSDPRRVRALKEAALAPAIYRQLAESYRDTGLPADEVLEAELTTYKGFNPKVVAGFVKDFRDTLDFAGINVSDALDSRDSDPQEEESQMSNAPEAARTEKSKIIPAGLVRAEDRGLQG